MLNTNENFKFENWDEEDFEAWNEREMSSDDIFAIYGKFAEEAYLNWMYFNLK